MRKFIVTMKDGKEHTIEAVDYTVGYGWVTFFRKRGNDMLAFKSIVDSSCCEITEDDGEDE